MSSSASRAWMMSGRPVSCAAAMWMRRLVCWIGLRFGGVVVVEAGFADARRICGWRARATSCIDRGQRFFGGAHRVGAGGVEDARHAPRRWRARCGSLRRRVQIVTIRVTPAARARAITSGSSPSKSGKSRWQWLSTSSGRVQRRASSGSPRGERARRLVDLQHHIHEKRGRVKVDRLAAPGAGGRVWARSAQARAATGSGARRASSAASPGAASGGAVPVVPARARRARNRSIRRHDQVEARLGAPRPAPASASASARGRSSRGRVANRRDERGVERQPVEVGQCGTPRPPSRRRVRPAPRGLGRSRRPPAARAGARSCGGKRRQPQLAAARADGGQQARGLVADQEQRDALAGGSSSSFRSALAALGFISSAQSMIATRRPPSAARELEESSSSCAPRPPR